MSHTKMRPAPPPLADAGEFQIRIACAGKTASQALEELRQGLADAAAAGRHPLVVLEELGRLQDSVVAFIKGLSRMLVDYPGPVTFWESSGYTEAFLSVMEQRRPVAPKKFRR
jgi:hypothetical protein